MTDLSPRLYLLTPILGEDAGPVQGRLQEACAAAEIAAVLLQLAAGDERTLVNAVKAVAPAAQEAGAAVVVSVPPGPDPVAVAMRGGADGLHVSGAGDWRSLRERLPGGRVLGAGGLRSRDEAMRAGEAGADYVMFGEPRPDGYVPPLGDVEERAAWWAEIFETPCVAYAPSLEAVERLAATGAEFVALGDAVWSHPGGPGAAVAAASRALRRASVEAAG